MNDDIVTKNVSAVCSSAVQDQTNAIRELPEVGFQNWYNLPKFVRN